MSVGERVYDLGAEPVKGTAKGVWGGFKAGAVILGVAAAAVAGGGLLALSAPVWAAVLVGAAAGGAGVVAGGAGGAYAGGVVGGLGGMFNGIRKFVGGRDKEPSVNEVELQNLRQQAALEDARTAAFQRQQARSSAMDGVNPDAATNNADKLARQAQAAQMAAGGRSA